MKRDNKTLILASRSPRRQYLLEQAGLSFKIQPAHIEEKRNPHETPEDYVRRLSLEKARHIGKKHPREWILGADTIVVMGDNLLEKPDSRDEARQMLQALSGRTHTVFTGFTICNLNMGRIITRAVQTRVRFKNLSPQEIEWYIGTEEPFDKAGAYAIQGIGTFIVKSIDGSYTNVVGLPVCEVIEILINEDVIQVHDELRP